MVQSVEWVDGQPQNVASLVYWESPGSCHKPILMGVSGYILWLLGSLKLFTFIKVSVFIFHLASQVLAGSCFHDISWHHPVIIKKYQLLGCLHRGVNCYSNSHHVDGRNPIVLYIPGKSHRMGLPSIETTDCYGGTVDLEKTPWKNTYKQMFPLWVHYC